jgi:hypothetical protein
MLTKRGSQHVCNTIPKSKEALIVNCAINVVERFLLGFYIFRGEKLKMITLEIANLEHAW